MNKLPNKKVLQLTCLILLLLSAFIASSLLSADQLLRSRQHFDRKNLIQFFHSVGFDNDLIVDTYLIPAGSQHRSLINLHLLGLRRDRFAYLAKQGNAVVAIAVPATADDGFNGAIDLLVAIDMFGRIIAARVLADLVSDDRYGVVDVINSRWMQLFSGKAMRDVRSLSWQSITAENEYDQFVGASITPKAVADRIYNAMVFFQSNRIALMAGEQ